MNKRLFAAAAAMVLALAVGAPRWAQAQSAAPSAILLCAHQTTGMLQIVASADDCWDKGSVFSLYTQQGNDERLAAIEARLTAVEGENAALRGQVEAQESRLAALESAVGAIADHTERLGAIEMRLADFAHFSTKDNEITITGANLNIVNGLGSTGTTNGLGNVVVGYGEPRPDAATDRSGSHMLVVGPQHNYSSYGGIVAGYRNTTSGSYASVSGGNSNVASAGYATVSGGYNNTASGGASAISGGVDNYATANGASVSGGRNNIASGAHSSVSGGADNTASQWGAAISGGTRNTADGLYATVSGGQLRAANGNYDWTAGGLFEDE